MITRHRAVALFALTLAGHPLHLSSTRLDLPAGQRVVEVQVRAFIDDLEEAMAAETGTMRRLGVTPASELDSTLAQHLRRRLLLSANGTPLALTYIGHERVDDAVELYATAPLPPRPTTLDVDQRLLLDRFPDQQNLVFVHEGSTRRSAIQRPGTTANRFRLD
jgi:hypothetical protein